MLLSLSLPMLLAGCSDEEALYSNGPDEQDVRLNVALPGEALTRTSLGERTGDTFPLLWSEGDRLSLNGTFSYPLAAENAGNRTASFSFRGSITSPYNVLYPASRESDKVIFPSTQRYRSGSFDPAALPMYGSTDTYTDAQLHHLGTLLGFPFIAPAGTTPSLKQLIIMSLDTEVISGTFTMEKTQAGAFTGAFAARDGATTAELAFPEGGLPLGNEAVTAWIALPAGEYPKGFSALVIGMDDQAMLLSFMTKENASHRLSPGTAVLYPATTFNPGAGLFIVDGPEDLVRLAAEPTAHPEVLVVRDIDMSSVTAWTPIEGFNGIFRAAGHTIKGLKRAVFGTLDGDVRNLVVDASIQSSETVLAAIANEISASGKVTSCTVKGQIAFRGSVTDEVYIGGIAAKCSGSILSSTVEATLEYAKGASSGHLYMGGMAALLTHAQEVRAEGLSTSEKASVIINYPSSGLPTVRAGGLFGCITALVITLSACTNETSLQAEVPAGVAKSRMWLGGIAGNVSSASDGTATFSACVNNGHFTINGKGGIGEDSAYARPSCMGGIVGKCQVSNASANTGIVFEDCVNNGNFTVTSSPEEYSVYGRNTYIAGICGDAISADIKDIRCLNTGNMSVSGYTDRFHLAGHIGIVWRREGTKTVLTVTGKGEDPVNTGTLAFYDGARCMRHPVASGVIGTMMAESATPLEFSIKDCKNVGKIDREAPPTAAFTVGAAYEASAGGIIGNIGYQSTVETYSFVTGTVEGCSNTAQLTINAYAGDDNKLEKAFGQSFLGGIVGFSHAKRGGVTVTNCTNSGYMQTTGGNTGGIVGRIQSKTAVTHCTNTGRVGEVGIDVAPLTYLSTGYAFCGGIVGALIFTDAEDNSKIEFCHNAGDISGSHVLNEGTGKGTARPTTGGIIGQYDPGRSYAAIRYCKNSGHLRCYRSFNGSSTYAYSGLISGSAMASDMSSSNPLVAKVSDCAVGGWCVRAGGWVSPTDADGDYPFYNYIYCYQEMDEGHPATTPDGNGYAEGCVVWDGKSKLSWEE